MRKLFLAAIFGLVGCTTAQVDTLDGLCGTAMTLAPVAGPIAPYIMVGCGTAEGLAKLASDPTSKAWVAKLIADVKAL